MHASRLEVHEVVRTKMRLHYGERDTHIIYIQVCSRHHTLKRLSVFLSTPTQTLISLCKQMNLHSILKETGRIETESQSEAENKDLCTGTPRGDLESS
jgi:hypothetical protein